MRWCWLTFSLLLAGTLLVVGERKLGTRARLRNSVAGLEQVGQLPLEIFY